MTSDASLRRTAIWVASLFLVTAIGAIAGATLINPVINASYYLSTVFIGLLMFPILRKQIESMALGYVSMRRH